jgi:ribosomal protein S18 acetylase RimI-like enzyme
MSIEEEIFFHCLFGKAENKRLNLGTVIHMMTIFPIEKEGPALEEVRELFREYETELGEDLCFQSFEDELKNPLKKYGPPEGILLLAKWQESSVACVALSPLNEPGICEMKRLYVRPRFRHLGIGKKLVEIIVDLAAKKEYITMKLDTLARLQPAIRLYEKQGFKNTSAYYKNPLPDVVYMERQLTAS